MLILRRDFDEITVRGRLATPRINSVQRTGDDGSTSNITVMNLTVVVNRSFKQPDGSYTEKPVYYEFSVWGEQADRYIERETLTKGTAVMVRGMPNCEPFLKSDGQAGIRVKIEAPPGGRIELFVGEKTGNQDNSADHADHVAQVTDDADEPPRSSVRNNSNAASTTSTPTTIGNKKTLRRLT